MRRLWKWRQHLAKKVDNYQARTFLNQLNQLTSPLRRPFLLADYIDKAMNQAVYELMQDEGVYCR